jgi:hypothetical protein
MAGLIVTGIVLYLLFPDFTVLASHTIGSDPIKSLGIGLLLVVAMPAIAILTMLTILGIPLGLILFVFYFAALLVGFLVTAFFLGDVGARAFLRHGPPSSTVRMLCLILALAVLALVNQLPIAGGTLMAAAVLVGLGAMSLHVWRDWTEPEPAADDP